MLDPFMAADSDVAPTDEGELPPWKRREMQIAFGLTGAGLLIAVALTIGFLMGRGDRDESAAPAASASAPSSASALPRPGRGALARLASDELARAVEGVAEDCGLRDPRGPSREILALAFQSCGRGRQVPSASSSPGATPSNPSVEPDATSTADPAAGARPERGPGAGAPAQGGCLQRCGTEQRQCQATECGPEPTQGSQYDEYQRCLTRCLSKGSQCKRRCG
jgi:hypothetical protein